MEERLQKIIARYGIASRRAAEQLILDRKVRVNGNTAVLGDVADSECDVIEVDGVRLKRKEPELLYVMLNKPRGYVTTMQDEKGRKNVSMLVSDVSDRVYPVGRLDMFSEGLLLMTNDGTLANRLMHPSKGIEKVYIVWVNGYTDGCEKILSGSIEIDGRMTTPANVKLLRRDNGQALFEITLHEGRNRQIRRLCEAAGLSVTRLKRIREGNLALGDLEPGKWRSLTENEISELLKYQ